MRFESLPAHEYVKEGIEDLNRGVESVAALLVSIGAPRLRQLGLLRPDDVPMNLKAKMYH